MLGILLKSLLFLLVAPGTVLVLVPCWLLRSEMLSIPLSLGAFRWFGLLPAILGLAILLWSFWAFALFGRGTPSPTDPPKVFVADGLYRMVRNPMYIGVLLVLHGEVFLFQSPVLFLYSLAVFLAFHLFVVFYEEPWLCNQFGDSYSRYVREVPRWLPRAPVKTTPDGSSEQD